MDSKKFIPVSIYLTPEDYADVMHVAKMLNQTKSGACELLIRRGLGKVGDFQIDQIRERGYVTDQPASEQPDA